MYTFWATRVVSDDRASVFLVIARYCVQEVQKHPQLEGKFNILSVRKTEKLPNSVAEGHKSQSQSQKQKPQSLLAAAFSLSFTSEYLLAVGLLVLVADVNPLRVGTYLPDELVEREVIHHPQVQVV